MIPNPQNTQDCHQNEPAPTATGLFGQAINGISSEKTSKNPCRQERQSWPCESEILSTVVPFYGYSSCSSLAVDQSPPRMNGAVVTQLRLTHGA